jgi:chromosome segregation protein
MLKALELVGFKSFAEKTRFEFPPGITVVVGPNGSGKSNVVDAIKWVLGEQSAKSLRGKDMADVIFKGGGSGGRKPMNAAEATIIFDNAGRELGFDSDEVHVTRRVYRSGEGEYLINGQACRLRDIKDLFRGTGVGADAYSIIEQGKLDVLLQASARERRSIFEEAAGISRFKAKKIEAQRRLERVDQNMLRLADIVEEVENRLRAVRSQASKAQRYKEHSERLQQLRTQVGGADWRRLTEKLAALESQLRELDSETAALAAELEASEQSSAGIETELGRLAQAVRDRENEAGRLRERIVTLEASIDNHRTRQGDFQREAARLSQQRDDSRARSEDVLERIESLRQDLAGAADDHQSRQEQLQSRQAAVREHGSELAAAREQTQQGRVAHGESLRRTAELSHAAREAESRLAAASAAAERAANLAASLAEALEKQLQQCADLRLEENRRAAEAADAEAALQAVHAQCDDAQHRLEGLTALFAELQAMQSAARERAAILEELELRQEGVSAGAREILARAKQEPDGPFSDACGLVADLVEVNVASAPLIDVALGDLAQYVVVKGDRLLEHLQEHRERFTGRVGLLPMGAPSPPSAGFEWEGRPGVIGRADLLVETSPWFRPLVRRLLGNTWFVEKLSDAFALRREGVAARLVTVAGELLESDGTLVIGPPRTAVGLISRRSELRAVREQIAAGDEDLAQRSGEIDELRAELNQLQEQVRRLHARHKEASAAHAEQRVVTQAAARECERLQRQLEAARDDAAAGCRQQVALESELAGTREQWEAEKQLASELASQVEKWESRWSALEAHGRDLAAAATKAQLEFAHSEHRLEDLGRQLAQCEQDQTERGRSLEEIARQIEACWERSREADRAILAATGEAALLYLQAETAAREAKELAGRSAEYAARRRELAEARQRLRGEITTRQERRHRLELSAGEVRHERQTLAERLREDYGIEIADLDRPVSEDELRQREEIDEEIAQLRRKLTSIGAVNLDALLEVEELEERFGKLSSQHQDLLHAKDALEKIVVRINADSRRLFAETLETIRQNFQAVFRKVFGGGRADIVLEEGVDILDAGIDIIATPPGKQSLTISLLSGGERALTAVSLMLAIFQFRPSPFCILDEVDGPLDEANIGRFLDQLHEYLTWTRFVIVTHSKKTMTAATTLYGVTMQESGVSKRVSVKFDDVSETGHIRQEAIDREPPAPGEDERAA